MRVFPWTYAEPKGAQRSGKLSANGDAFCLRLGARGMISCMHFKIGSSKIDIRFMKIEAGGVGGIALTADAVLPKKAMIDRSPAFPARNFPGR